MAGVTGPSIIGVIGPIPSRLPHNGFWNSLDLGCNDTVMMKMEMWSMATGMLIGLALGVILASLWKGPKRDHVSEAWFKDRLQLGRDR